VLSERVSAHAHTSRVTITSRFIVPLPVSPMIDARACIVQLDNTSRSQHCDDDDDDDDGDGDGG